MTNLSLSFPVTLVTYYSIVMTVLLLLVPVLIWRAIKLKNSTYLTMVVIIFQLFIAPYVYLALRIGASRLAEML